MGVYLVIEILFVCFKNIFACCRFTSWTMAIIKAAVQLFQLGKLLWIESDTRNLLDRHVYSNIPEWSNPIIFEGPIYLHSQYSLSPALFVYANKRFDAVIN